MIKPAASDITEVAPFAVLSGFVGRGVDSRLWRTTRPHKSHRELGKLVVAFKFRVNLGSAVPCELYLGPAIINLVIGLNQSKSDQILE